MATEQSVGEVTYRDGREVIIVPAGTYFLGDPCYVLSDKDYDRYVLATIGCDEDEVLERNAEDSVVVFSTHHGDGTFEDQHGNGYMVDSGHIGLVPFTETRSKDEHAKYMQKVTFEQPVECFNERGVLHFGTFVINTTW